MLPSPTLPGTLWVAPLVLQATATLPAASMAAMAMVSCARSEGHAPRPLRLPLLPSPALLLLLLLLPALLLAPSTETLPSALPLRPPLGTLLPAWCCAHGCPARSCCAPAAARRGSARCAGL